MAKSLISEHSHKFDPTKYKNHYTEALRSFVEKKLKSGKTVAVGGDDEAPKTGQVVDFMEALKRSLKGDDAKTTREALQQDNAPDAKAAARRGAKKPAAKRLQQAQKARRPRRRSARQASGAREGGGAQAGGEVCDASKSGEE